MESEINNDVLARLMYQAYYKEAGGLTFDGKPLPTWYQLGAPQHRCWIAAARAAKALL
jgi:hypothetical protein